MNQVYCSHTKGNDGEVRGIQVGGSEDGAVGGVCSTQRQRQVSARQGKVKARQG